MIFRIATSQIKSLSITMAHHFQSIIINLYVGNLLNSQNLIAITWILQLILYLEKHEFKNKKILIWWACCYVSYTSYAAIHCLTLYMYIVQSYRKCNETFTFQHSNSHLKKKLEALLCTTIRTMEIVILP